MSNIEVSLPCVDGSMLFPHEYGESCKLAVHTLYSDDYAAAPRSLNIEVKTESGKIVKVVIPYSHEEHTTVIIDGEII